MRKYTAASLRRQGSRYLRTASWIPAFAGMLILLLCLGGLLFSAQAATKESAYERVIRTGVLKIGYSVWPPYQILDPNTGEISGIAADHAEALGKLLDLKIEWVQLSGLGTQVEGFKQGLYDVVANDGPYVFSMIKFIDFSDPLYYAPVYAYVREDNHRFHKLADLNDDNVTLVGIDGDLSVDLANRLYPRAKLYTLPASTDPGMILINVQTKKADAAIIDPGTINTFNKNNKPGLKAVAVNASVAVYPIGYSMMKDDGKLLTLINGAVAAMHNTNMVTPVLDKWLPAKDDYYPVAKPYEIVK